MRLDYACARSAALAVIVLIASGCASFYRLFPGQGSTFYDKSDLELLKLTTKAMDFDYGYDADLELDYVFPLYEGFDTFKPADRELEKALAAVDGRSIITFNEKIYRFKKITENRMARYRDAKDWKSYTFLSKYIAPAVEYYAAQIEKQALKRDPSYRQVIDERKRQVEDDMRTEELRREFEELWKNDYQS